MATSNSTVSERPSRAQRGEILDCALVLFDVELALEMRDNIYQDRNPSMTATVRMIAGRLMALAEQLDSPGGEDHG